MKDKKIDRWDREGQKLAMTGERITGFDVADRLNREHAWVMRMVKGRVRMALSRRTHEPAYEIGRADEARDILAKLKERAK